MFVAGVALAIFQLDRPSGHATYFSGKIVPSLQVMREVSVDLGDLRRFEYRHILSNDDATRDAHEKRITDIERNPVAAIRPVPKRARRGRRGSPAPEDGQCGIAGLSTPVGADLRGVTQ
jgi:hypothetical protein